LIAATNCDLKNSISEGGFREDLYYRLSVFTIQLPSLRTRPEDIAELADHFLSQFGGKARKIAESSLQLLKQHSWKGNIRELKNVIERAAILADGSEILPEHLPFEIQQQNAANPHELSLAAIEKQHIQKILQYTGGNKAKAARLLEIGLATLYRKMEEYNIVSTLSK
jgi:two-component system, NtrC family, response regulator